MYKYCDKDKLIKELYTPQSLTDEYSQDIAFLERIKSQTTIDGQLPFDVPIDNIPQIIYNCSEWYFRKCEDASEEKWLLIPQSVFKEDANLNIEVPLPFRILSVNEVGGTNTMSQWSTMPYSYKTAFRYESMFMTASNWSSMNMGGYNNSFVNGMYNSAFTNNIGDSILAVFAQGDLQSMFSKHYRTKYNRNTRKLRFLDGMPQGDLVLNVTERVLLQDLYYDDRFIRYVVGHVLLNLSFVLGVFDFKMPGNITINAGEYKERGQQMIDDVKEELAEDDDSPIIMFS